MEVKLKVKITEDQDVTTNLYSLDAEVVEYANIPREVFVYMRDLEGNDIFQAVATPVRIEEFPYTEPEHPGGFFRKYTLSLTFSILQDRTMARAILENKLQQLVTEWEVLYPDIVNEEEIEFVAGEP